MFSENVELQNICQENFLLNSTDDIDDLINNFEEVLIDEAKTNVRLLKDLLKMEDTEFGSKEENL